MSDASPIRCHTCEQPLGASHHLFGFQWHQLHYELPGETPSEQAVMRPRALTTLARFCSSACCKQQVAGLLQAQGLAPHLQHNRVGGGPIAPCGKCGKPVNMNQPHGAWIKGKVTADIQNGDDDLPDWLDVLTVVCPDCAGPYASAKRQQSRRTSLDFEQLLQELAAIDASAPADEDLDGPMIIEREPLCGA